MQKQQQSQSSYTTETHNNDEETTPSVTKLWRQKADATKATGNGRSKAPAD